MSNQCFKMNKRGILVLISCLQIALIFRPTIAYVYTIPSITFEALKQGGFIAYIPDTGNATFFILNINLNTNIRLNQPGQLHGETRISNNGYLIINFDKKLNHNDVLNYWVFIAANRGGYTKQNLSWKVTDLKDSYTLCEALPSGNAKIECSKDLVDDFQESSINTAKWIVEHRIPTYTSPRFEFNSYQKTPETVFINNGILYLQPIAFNSEDDVRGTLNLGDSCTSFGKECKYTQITSFLLPPVKSAKITSKQFFKYGKFEIKAKLPAGDWIFPIIELNPKDSTEYSTLLWIAYSRGNEFLTGNSGDDIGSRLLFAGPISDSQEPNRSRNLVSRRSSIPYSDGFHIYTFEWTSDKLRFYIDDELYGDIDNKNSLSNVASDGFEAGSLFDSECSLSLGVGIGGLIDFPDQYLSRSGEKPWYNSERNYIKNFFGNRTHWLSTWNGTSSALQIDYVKVTSIS